ncbi:MAG TPA: IPTL-CTERM sorting domain-containing protein [Xanthomonadales bacterium]|nr:IPTL-CTERM sorting domain-containing protein [Xanthomonadales bacterium]
MTIKRVFLTLLAALLLPGLAYAQTQTRATFTVQKEFTDGNSVTPVTVNIQCFTGVPLNQEATRVASGGDFEVEFVVESFDNGQLDCEIWEDAVAGYSADYEVDADNAESTQDSDDGADACEFENVSSGGENLCIITNSPDPVEVEVCKDWVIEGSDGADVDQNYQLTLQCDNPILGENEYYGYWDINFYGEGNNCHTAAVIPDWEGGTNCSVDEDVYDSAVESSNPCGNLDVDIASSGVSCTVTNTAFFEGIPTLSQYGLAILALLMLGVGFVGFRRFV